ncbi:MAG: MFS transporter [Bacteroidia bacterium]
MKYLTRTVWILSLISLFTDTASEMLYPVMPVYLESIGFSVVLIGILEGLAEATAGLSKGYFGKRSDLSARRAPFVQAGYALSAVSKPMMAIFVYPLWIFFARTLDRFGKGIRTGARDALLSDEATPQTKGKVFGFHRAMDTLGAVIGPALALIYLHYYPKDYRTLFFLAFAPGVMAVVASFLLKDKNPQPGKLVRVPFFSFLSYWKKSPAIYRRLVAGLLFFALFNSSDMFLLLRAKQSGLDDADVIGMYIFYNLIYALASFPAGILADRLGLKNVFTVGLGLFALVYLGMALSENVYGYYGLFFLYGIYAASTEGISKAWITNISDKEDTATAIGTYVSFQSLCTMLASAITGVIWYYFGVEAAFITSGIVALGVMVYFLIGIERGLAKED